MSSPRASAAKSGSNGTSSPSTSTVTPQVEPVAGISLLAPLAGAEPDDRSGRDLLVGRDVAVDLDA